MAVWVGKSTGSIKESAAKPIAPYAIANAVVLGTLLGLMPKDNLVALCLGFLILALPTKFVTALVTTIAVSLLHFLTFPIADWIGRSLLEASSLHVLWIWIYKQPILPWAGLNNSIVLGSFVLGLGSSIPIYTCSLFIAKRAQRNHTQKRIIEIVAEANIHRQNAFRVARARKLAALDEPHVRVTTRVDVSRPQLKPNFEIEFLKPVQDLQYQKTNSKTVQESLVIGDQIVRLDDPAEGKLLKSKDPRRLNRTGVLAIKASEESSARETAHIIRRELKRLAINEMYESETTDSELSRSATHDKSVAKLASLSSPIAGSDSGQHWISETMIELVRFLPKSGTLSNELPINVVSTSTQENHSSFDVPRTDRHTPNQIEPAQRLLTSQGCSTTPTTINSMNNFTPNTIPIRNIALPANEQNSAPKTVAPEGTPSVEADRIPSVNQPREESLRYLLWHLSGINREKRA